MGRGVLAREIPPFYAQPKPPPPPPSHLHRPSFTKGRLPFQCPF